MKRWLLCLALAVPAFAQDDPNLCDVEGEAPDLVVGDLQNVQRWGALGGVTAFSVGTTSCNVGTCWAEWFEQSDRHPVIGQNAYRLKDGRFEQIGQSWLKHGFFALSGNLCGGGCDPGDTQHLGVNCSDPYEAPLNGLQGGLGPKYEVNASTGEFPYPYSDIDATGDLIYKRLQLKDDDIDPAANPGARFFVEGHYVARDDAAAGNDLNNASWREVNILGGSGFYGMFLTGETVQEETALHAWQRDDPEVVIDAVDIPLDGRVYVAGRATERDDGLWSYEYAVHNYNSHASVGQFIVELPEGARATEVGFHDVDYHSGDPTSGEDWSVTHVGQRGPRSLRWSTVPAAIDPDANAIRWSTLYNFRFVTDAPPESGTVRLRTWRDDPPRTLAASVPAPSLCNADGVCDGGESCKSCAIDCGSCCGNGICGPDEDPCSCSTDCGDPAIRETTCGDAIDDDCDGAIDCDDEDCGLACDSCDGEELRLQATDLRIDGGDPTRLHWPGAAFGRALRAGSAEGLSWFAADQAALPGDGNTALEQAVPAPGALFYYRVFGVDGCPAAAPPEPSRPVVAAPQATGMLQAR